MGRRQACGETFGSGSSRAVPEAASKTEGNPSLGKWTSSSKKNLSEKIYRLKLQVRKNSIEYHRNIFFSAFK